MADAISAPDQPGAGRQVLGPIVKTMSLSRSEFDNSLASFAQATGYLPLAAGDAKGGGGPDAVQVKFGVAGGEAMVSYVALPAATFGGLLKLPRAQVTLIFAGVAPDAEAAFLRSFEIAFQRGGG